jgi:hypothetical protein
MRLVVRREMQKLRKPSDNWHPAPLARSKLTKDDGKFDHDAILAWQHTMMYLAFGISGCVDLLGTKVKLPQGTEQVGAHCSRGLL